MGALLLPTLEVQQVPFPHLVADGLWDYGLLVAARDSFPPPDSPTWHRFDNQHERKLGGSSDPHTWPVPVGQFMAQLASAEVCEWIGDLFDIPNLFADAYGGGMHMIPPGGFLDVHVDFNRHPVAGFRRINLLVYLNEGWQAGMGGELMLRETPTGPIGRDVIVEPTFGRTAIFATSESSWHGHPEPTVGYWRRSIACYYYSPEPSPDYEGGAHDTIYPEELAHAR